MTQPIQTRDEKLRTLLEGFHGQYHRAEFLPGDPLHFAHRFHHREDQEVAALLAAAFASGNIKSILAVLNALQVVMGDRPARWLTDRKPAQLRGALGEIRHRWVRPEDAEVLLAMIGCALRQHGSLGSLWKSLDDDKQETVLPTLGKFVAAIQAMQVYPLQHRQRSARRADDTAHELPPITSILLTSPDRGSACKRMNLFLRWMVRPADGVDLGLWSEFVSASRLVMPVDVHVMRLCCKLRLTRRPNPDQQSAHEITRRFRRITPADPCRYDFSIVRAGIADMRLP